MRITVLAVVIMTMLCVVAGVVPAAPKNPVNMNIDQKESSAAVAANRGTRDLAKALEEAGHNRAQLESALKAVNPKHRKAMEFLIVNMPKDDLVSLKKDYLVDNVEYAYKARKTMPWGKDVPEDLFLNDVLPYSNLTERRDNWRKDFYDRFSVMVKDCKTMEDAVLKLNIEVFKTFNVQYHATKCRKPNQSPYESIEIGYASCSSLSILITDACRAVGIPSRVVGVLCWDGKPENHCWSEVWTHEWRYIGAGEPNNLDTAWFTERVSKIDPTKPEYAVFAISFKRTGTCFPPAWRYSVRDVYAENVTDFYIHRRSVKVGLVNGEGKSFKAKVALKLGGETIVQDIVDGSRNFIIAGGQTYDAEITDPETSQTVTKKVTVPNKDNETVYLSLWRG